MATTTTSHDKDNEYDRRLPPLPLPPLRKEEDKQDSTQQAPHQASSSSCPLPSHDSHAAPAEASAWAYKIVRGSLYVVGPAIEALAETGHAHCLHHASNAGAAASRSCMVPSLEPALFTRARSDRELRDGPAHHLTLLHRTEIQVEEGGKEGGREDGGEGDRNDDAAAAVPTSAISASASSSPCKQTGDENEPPSLAPTLHGSLSTMPEDSRNDQEEEAQEEGGREGGAQGESQPDSIPAVFLPSSSSFTHHRHHHDDDNEDKAVAAALLATLTTPLITHLLPFLPPLLHVPLPLYVYRTSGEGRALAVSVLFLPGEWLRHWQGQVYRPMHVTLGFVERDERDLEARQLGRVSVLGYGLSRRTMGEVLKALVGVLVKEGGGGGGGREEGGGGGGGEGGREGGSLDGFLPRVRVLAGEVLRVLEMRMEGGREGGWEEEEEEEEGMDEIMATLTACKQALGCLPSGAALGVEGNETEKEKETCSSSPSSLESMLRVCDGLSAVQLEAMGNKAGRSRHDYHPTARGTTGHHLEK